MRTKWTVVMLYPDYLAENYGEDMVTTKVQAPTVKEAENLARREATRVVSAASGAEVKDPNDFFVLAVFEGWHDNQRTI